MIGLFLAYGAGRAAGRARERRESLPDGYAEFELAVLLAAAGVGLIWPIHLGYKLAQWGLRMGWAIAVAIVAGFLGLATGWGYLVIGFIYSGIWVAGLIVRSPEDIAGCRQIPYTRHAPRAAPAEGSQ